MQDRLAYAKEPYMHPPDALGSGGRPRSGLGS